MSYITVCTHVDVADMVFDSEKSELEERDQGIVDTIKKAAAIKGNEVHDTRNNAKAPDRRENAAATEANHTLDEAEAQEIDRRSMKCSSKVANQRGGIAQLEHRRQDGWTSTPCGSDGVTAGKRLQEQRPHPIEKIQDDEGAQEVDTGNGCSGGCDLRAGERLPKQRPLGDEHPEHNSEEHLGAQVPHQVEVAGSIVFHSSRNASVFENDNKEAQVTTSAAAKESEEFLDKDAEILRLIEERRSIPKEEKQRLKDLSKSLKKCIREKKNGETARH